MLEKYSVKCDLVDILLAAILLMAVGDRTSVFHCCAQRNPPHIASSAGAQKKALTASNGIYHNRIRAKITEITWYMICPTFWVTRKRNTRRESAHD